VIATGFAYPSENRKTGPMIQTWILREDMDPREAVWSGGDTAICGECVHRGEVIEKLKKVRGKKRRQRVRKSHNRSCYVVVAQAPLSIWRGYHEGAYPEISLGKLAELFSGSYPLRIGSYGDPLAVPVQVWEQALKHQVVWTGYTHQWKRKGAYRYKKFLMASVDSPKERAQAEKKGWRTFRVGRKNEPLIAGVEIICPATAEGGMRTTCDACNLCMGASKKGAKSIVVAPHGSMARYHEERGQKRSKKRVKNNPLLAIVGNPPRNPLPPPTDEHHYFMGRDRLGFYVYSTETGWRSASTTDEGLARVWLDDLRYPKHYEERRKRRKSKRVANNPLLAIVGNPHDELTAAELRELESFDADGFLRKRSRNPVAATRTSGRVNTRDRGPSKKKVRGNRTSKASRKKSKTKTRTRRVSLEEAKKFEGYEEAVKAYKRFHGRKPKELVVYEIDDGRTGKTRERVHAALHRTVETNYLVPWDSNKRGNFWKHEHVEGYGLDGSRLTEEPDEEEFPLEILDPATGTTRKIAGRFRVTSWWYD
jgi:hypothetical protein